jgi:hypothetical protein
MSTTTKEAIKARILATANPKPIPIPNLPEWGDIYIKRLTVGDIETTAAEIAPSLRTARGIARVLCDASGELVFDPENIDDLTSINSLPSEAVSHIHAAMDKANASTEQEAKALGNASPPGIASS